MIKELRDSESILLKIAYLSMKQGINFLADRDIWDAFQLGRDYEKAVKTEEKNNG